MMLENIAQAVMHTFSLPTHFEEDLFDDTQDADLSNLYIELVVAATFVNVIAIFVMANRALKVQNSIIHNKEKRDYLWITMTPVMVSATLTAISLMVSPPTRTGWLNVVKILLPCYSLMISCVSTMITRDINLQNPRIGKFSEEFLTQSGVLSRRKTTGPREW